MRYDGPQAPGVLSYDRVIPSLRYFYLPSPGYSILPSFIGRDVACLSIIQVGLCLAFIVLGDDPSYFDGLFGICHYSISFFVNASSAIATNLRYDLLLVESLSMIRFASCLASCSRKAVSAWDIS